VLRSSGFSLVELVFALFILSIVLLGMMKLQISFIHQNAFSGKMSTAIALAQNQMETLINQDLDAIGGIFAPDSNPWPSPDSQLKVDPDPEIDPVIEGTKFTGYTVDWDVTANEPIRDTATLRVQVQWPRGNHPINLVNIKRR
jgi:prepilin-type N-terminal cleavage/methylation domain-containing protein